MSKDNFTKNKIQAYLTLKKGVLEKNLNNPAKKIMLATLPCITLGFGNINTLNAATSTRVINATVNHVGILAIDIDNAGGNDLSFNVIAGGMGINDGAAASIHVHDIPGNFFQKLDYGAIINTGDSFNTIANGGYIGITYNTTACTAPWNADGPGFLGVKFFISGQLHVGWIALDVTDKEDASGSCAGGSNQPGRKIKIIKAGWNTTSIASGGTSITIQAGVLSVELTSFKAKVADKQVQLLWNTATENDNAGFEIERGTDGKNYQTLAFVEGKGNTTENQQYAYDDKDLIGNQLYYYRIKQIDYDGRFEYSKVITAQIERGNVQTSAFYPNPSQGGQTRLDYTTTKTGELQIEVFDLSGKQLIQVVRNVTTGKNTLDFDFSALGKGLFFIKMNQEADSVYQKLIIE